MNVHAYIVSYKHNCNLQAQYHKLNTAEMGIFFFLVCHAIISGISTMVTFHHLI